MTLTDRVAHLTYQPDDPYDDYNEYRIGREASTGTIRLYKQDDEQQWDAFDQFDGDDLNQDAIIDKAKRLIVAHKLEPKDKTPERVLT